MRWLSASTIAKKGHIIKDAESLSLCILTFRPLLSGLHHRQRYVLNGCRKILISNTHTGERARIATKLVYWLLWCTNPRPKNRKFAAFVECIRVNNVHIEYYRDEIFSIFFHIICVFFVCLRF